MPWARSDRKNKPRISVMAKRLAQFISHSFRIDNVLLLDPHDGHLKHYFEPDADEITALYLLLDYVKREMFKKHPAEEWILVFADGGAAKRFEYVPHILQLPTAYIDKGRKDDDVGDVSGRRSLLIDDEALTGNTALKDAELLLEAKAASVSAVFIHGPLADKRKKDDAAVVKMIESSKIDHVITTDSVPVEVKLSADSKIVVLSVAALSAEAISRTVQNASITYLYDPLNIERYR
jgi:ribose-phosphate pyrophosphokinase